MAGPLTIYCIVNCRWHYGSVIEMLSYQSTDKHVFANLKTTKNNTTLCMAPEDTDSTAGPACIYTNIQELTTPQNWWWCH